MIDTGQEERRALEPDELPAGLYCVLCREPLAPDEPTEPLTRVRDRDGSGDYEILEELAHPECWSALLS